MTGRSEHQEVEPLVWQVLDLDPLPIRNPYRPETTRWADCVNWAVVNEVAIAAVRKTNGQSDPWQDYGAGLLRREVDREGLSSLFTWPIDANPQQITNGIHRLSAMRKQGVSQTVGLLIE